LSGRDLHRGAARSRDLPEVAAIDIALVGGVDDLVCSGRKVHILHFELAWRQRRDGSAGGRKRVEGRPAIGFPGKDNVAVRSPQELISCRDVTEDASGSGFGAPDLAALTGPCIGDSYGPGFAAALRLTHSPLTVRRDTDEGDTAAVGRPLR